jgi:XTP/dITP diphosphohydrolase
MLKIVLATSNKNKVKEIKNILGDKNFIFLSHKDFPDIKPPEETGTTFKENAIIKAKEICRLTGMICLADDSGLEVEALNGQPGVYSSRFSGKDATDKKNIEKLLSLLKNIPYEKRKARFICAIAIAYPDGKIKTVEGKCQGIIGFETKGENGFGYDPVFIYPKLNKTFAEIPEEIKNNISHRRNALEKAKKILMKY